MKALVTAVFAVAMMTAPFAVSTKANACTNSYDKASDGSNCGGRASGCKAGGRGGYC
jgi:hypothetical protein